MQLGLVDQVEVAEQVGPTGFVGVAHRHDGGADFGRAVRKAATWAAVYGLFPAREMGSMWVVSRCAGRLVAAAVSLVPGVFHHVDALAEHRFDDFVLRAEVVVERGGLDADLLGDLALGHASYPALETSAAVTSRIAHDVDVDHGHGGDAT